MIFISLIIVARLDTRAVKRFVRNALWEAKGLYVSVNLKEEKCQQILSQTFNLNIDKTTREKI